MKKNLTLALALLFCSMLFTIARAQQITPKSQTVRKADTTNVGTANGILRDSVHNYAMLSATLAVYKVEGNVLLSYQFSNVYGKYQFKQLPVGVPLRLIATHVGYNSSKKEFTISPKTKTIDLKTINMDRIDLTLKEVVVAADVAPMQMHGDTLEFNAAAFKLDTNAVVEDLLNNLPGVTVWADGVITVNGKKINQLLVEGKPFFNGDNKIALQNIQKDAVKKIQVYQNKNDPDPMNPKTDMNIVLKKAKKDFYFGKFGVGGGTQDHYAFDGSLSYVSPKTSFAIVGAANNVNKKATDVGTLQGFNSFKGEGINNDYHSDFRQEGHNTYKGGGFNISHDFSKDDDARQPYAKTNMLKGEFFMNDGTNNTISDSKTVTTIDANSKINQTSSSNRSSDNFGQRSSGSYEKRFYYGESLNASFDQSSGHGNSSNTSTSSSVNDLTGAQSQSLSQSNATNSQNNLSGSIRVGLVRRYDMSKRKYKGINADINYNFKAGNSTNDSKQITNIRATDTTQNRYFNRLYQTNNNNFNNTLTVTFRDLTSMFYKRRSPPLLVDLANSLSIYDFHETVDVGDLTSATGTVYTPNNGLTNISHYKTIDEKPSLNFNKYFSKSLDNRFYKSWNVGFQAQGQMYSQRNSALQSFQNLERTYYYFIPTANLGYYNQQYGEFRKDYGLSYNTNVQFPTVSQMEPLNDDSNPYNITLPNPNLKPAYNHYLNFRYNYYDEKNKNAMNASIYISGGYTENNIIDSVKYNTQLAGGMIHHYINGYGSKNINYTGTINKAFKFGNQQFQLTGNSGSGYSRYSSSVNGRMYDANNTSLNASAVVIYSYKSIWSGGAGEYFSGNKTNLVGFNTNTNYTWTTNFGFAFAFPRSVFFNTRVNFNNTKSSTTNNAYYTIWNADFGYRFLKGAEGEIKLSALDLLHQNRAIYNYSGNNSSTTTTVNVLQQYFMLTLAYYPRKFGLSKK